MAVDLLLPHIGPDDGADALAQLRAEHAAMFSGASPGPAGDGPGWDDVLGRAAADRRDPHQVELVEACRRGDQATGTASFAAAARRVTTGR